MSNDPLLTTREAAAFLKLYPDTLKKWRRVHKGPAFRKIGERCVRYSSKDLQEWLQALSSGPTGAPCHV